MEGVWERGFGFELDFGMVLYIEFGDRGYGFSFFFV